MYGILHSLIASVNALIMAALRYLFRPAVIESAWAKRLVMGPEDGLLIVPIPNYPNDICCGGAQVVAK